MARSAVVAIRTLKLRVVVGAGLGALLAALGVVAVLDVDRVRASGQTITLSGPDTLGRGLQDGYTLRLSEPAPPGGLVVTLISADPAACVMSLTESGYGQSPLDITIPYNHRRAFFVIQSLSASSAASCSVSVTNTVPSGWSTPSLSVNIVKGKLRLRELVRTISSLASDQPFFVEVGVPSASGGLRFVQGLSKGTVSSPTPDLNVHVCSSDKTIGTIVNRFGQDLPLPDGDGCEDNPITSPFSRTVPGDFQFDPVAGHSGDVTVTATATGFDNAQKVVHVRGTSVTIRGAEELGAHLQDDYSLALSDAATTNLTVDVCTSDRTICAVAATENSLADTCTQVIVPIGRYRAEFVVQGVATGTCTVTVNAGATFGTDDITIQVKDPALQIRELPETIGQYAPNAPIFVELGVPNGPENRRLVAVQALRKGLVGESPLPTPLPVTAKSDAPGVGTIVNAAGQDNPPLGEETTDAPLTFSRTVPGALQFDPLAGSDIPVNVTATAPGFISDTDDEITVRSAQIEIHGPRLLGSRLQDNYKVQLVSAAGHPTTVVRVTALPEGSVQNCRVAPSANTVGTNYIDLTIATNETSADFFVAAEDDLPDNTPCRLEATATGFEKGTYTIMIMEPGIQIRQLPRNISAAAANAPFFVEVGVPNSNKTALRTAQPLRKGTANVDFKVCSSYKDVGTIVDVFNVDNNDDGCEEDEIVPPFANNVPGNLKFDPKHGGSAMVEVKATGFHTMDRTGRVEVRVGALSIAINGPDTLGRGLQDTYRLRLSSPAPSPGGLQATLTADDDTVCVLSANSNSLGQKTLVLTIPAGDQRASFALQSLPNGTADGCKVTVQTNPTGWDVDPLEVKIVKGRLKIRNLVSTISNLAPNEPFFVEVGVPNRGDGLRFVQSASKGKVGDPALADIQVQVCAVPFTTATIVDRNGQDNPPLGCETVPIRVPFSRTVPGDVQLDPQPNQSGDVTVTTTATGFDPDDQKVNVRAATVTIRGADELGAELQDTYVLLLSEATTTNLTVDVCVPSDLTYCAVGATPNSLATDCVHPTVQAGRARADFVVQGLKITPDGVYCAVTVNAGLFGTSTKNIEVKQPALHIRDLPGQIGQFAPNNPFFAELGVPSASGNGLRFVQQLRKGTVGEGAHGQLPVQAESSNKGAATIVNVVGVDVNDDGKETVYVTPTFARTVPGELQLDPRGGGDTTVTVTTPGYDFIPDSKDVTVRAAQLRITGPEELGRRLQDDYRVHLDAASGHPATTVTIKSNNTDRCQVSPNANSAPTPDPLPRNVAAGDSAVEFAVHALDTMPDLPCEIEASAADFGTAKFTITIKQSGLQMRQLPHSIRTDAPNADFFVEVGVPNSDGSALKTVQKVGKAVVGTVQFTVCSSKKNVGTIVDKLNVDNGDDGCESDQILQAQDRNVPGDLKFDPRQTGTTRVEVTSTGFLTMSRTGRVDVKVGNDTVRLGPPVALGLGLQAQASISLSKPGTSSVNVMIASQTPTFCKVATAADVPAADNITVPIAVGEDSGTFYVAGYGLGTCRLTAMADGYQDDEVEFDVVPYGIQIVDLPSTTGIGAPDAPFDIEIGVPVGSPSGGRLRVAQAVRFGGPATEVKVCSDNTTVGTILGGMMVDANCRKDSIQPQSKRVTFSFHVQGITGSTKVTATSGEAMDMQTVRVAATVVKITGPKLLGKDLQGTFSVVANHKGGATTTVYSDTPAICVVSDTGTTAGAANVPITIPSGTNRAPFYVQALQLGLCQLRVSGSGFPDFTLEVPVVYARLRITGLQETLGSMDPNDPFIVEIGPANPDVPLVMTNRDNRNSITEPMPRNPGLANLSINVCSSNPAAGIVHDPLNSPIVQPTPVPECVYSFIASGSSSTPNFEFEPNNEGQTIVSAEAPGSDVLPTRETVNVKPVVVNLRGPDTIGKDLQAQFTVHFTKAPPNGTTVTVTVIDSETLGSGDCGLSAANNQPPDPDDTLPISVPDGRTEVDFWVQGLATGSCEIRVDTTAVGFGSARSVVGVVTPAVRISHLDPTLSTSQPNDPFDVEIGVPTSGLRTLSMPQQVRVDPGTGQPYDLPYDGIPLKVCSSVTTVGTVVGGTADGNCSKGTIPPLSSGLFDFFSFDPANTGTTYVYIDKDKEDVPLQFTKAATVKVTVVADTISVRGGPDNLGNGLQETYTGVLSKQAQSDSTCHLDTVTPANCVVAPAPTGPFGNTASVPISKGRTRCEFTVQAIAPMAMVDCVLHPSVDLTGYTPVDRTVSIVAPSVQIVNLDTSRATLSADEPFNVEIGIPRPTLTSLADTQDAGGGGGGEVIKVCAINPPTPPKVGTIVGAGLDDCKYVTVPEGKTRSLDGDLKFDALSAGTVTICAEAPGYQPIDNSCRDVVVSAVVVDISGPDKVGAGLQQQYNLVTSSPMPADTDFTVQVDTDSSDLCYVAATAASNGSGQITVRIPARRSRAPFYVQGLENVMGLCQLHLKPPVGNTTVAEGLGEIEIVQSGLQITALDTSLTSQSPNDDFYVVTGVPSMSLRAVSNEQAVRHGASQLPVSVCSSRPLVGQIVGADSTSCKVVYVQPEHSRTAAGALYFDPIGNDPTTDTTTVTAAAAGYISTDAASKDVKVANVILKISGADKLGSGLQDQFSLVTNAALASDTDFTVEVKPASTGVCQVANNATSAGSGSIIVRILANRSRATFYVQGLDNVMGDCELRLKPPTGSTGITEGTGEIEIVQSGLRIINLDTSRSSQSLNDDFNVEVGVPSAGLRSLANVQARRHGGTAINVTVCSSRQLVGEIVGDDAYGCKVAYVSQEQSRTPDGALSFDAIGNDPATDTTTVDASAPSFISTDAASKDVTVTAVSTNINGSDSLGSSLEDDYTLVLSSAPATDIYFTVSSTTPDVCKVSLNEAETPSISINNVPIPHSRTRATFYVHAMDNVMGTCSLTATTTALGFSPGSRDIDVVMPALSILGLQSNLTTTSSNDAFTVQTGVPSQSLRTLSKVQERRYGANLTVTACSSNPDVGKIVSSTGTAACGDAVVQQNTSETATNALAFDPNVAGTTTVTATAPGFIPIDASSKDVDVSQATINLDSQGLVDALGAGLQDTYTVSISGRAPSPSLHIKIESLTTSVCVVAQDEAHAGTGILDVYIPGGRSSLNFAIQAVENVMDTCRVHASAPENSAYAPADLEVPIRQPGLRIRSLDATTVVGASADSFVIETGLPRGDLRDLRWVQSVRKSAPTPLTVTACSSNVNVGKIANGVGSPDQCKTTTIAQGVATTGSTTLQFIASNTAGGTTVVASAPGYITTDAGSIDVVVAPVILSFSNSAANDFHQIGAGLMDTFKVLAKPDVGAAVTVTVESLTSSTCKVALNESSISGISVGVPFNPGSGSQSFAVHGMENQTGPCRLKAYASGFETGYVTYDIVRPALKLSYLGGSKTATSSDDPFYVNIGVAKEDLSTIDVNQKVRYGSSGFVVYACSSDGNVGIIIGSGPPDVCNWSTIPAGADNTTSTGLKFRVTGNGTTTVEANAPNVITTAAGSDVVTVSGFSMSLVNTSTTSTIGAGLQQGTFLVRRVGSTNTAKTVTVASLAPAVCKVSVVGTAAGGTSAAVTIPAGATDSPVFWIQGITSVTGSCQVHVSDAYYLTTGSDLYVTAVLAGLRVRNVPGSIPNNYANVLFYVDIGIPTAGSADVTPQEVRGGGSFSVNVTNSNGAVAQLVYNATTSQSQVTVTIPGASSSNSGSLQFDPLTTGSTTVRAQPIPAQTVPITTDQKTISVTDPPQC